MDSIFFEQLLGYLDLGVFQVRVLSDGFHVDCYSNLAQGLGPKTLEKSDVVICKRQRVVRELSILGKAVTLHIQVRKFKSASGTYFWEELSVVRPHSHFTKRYETFIFESCKGTDMTNVAQKEGLSVDSVMGIFHLYAKKNLIA